MTSLNLQKIQHPMLSQLISFCSLCVSIEFYATFLPFLFWVSSFVLTQSSLGLIPSKKVFCAAQEGQVLRSAQRSACWSCHLSTVPWTAEWDTRRILVSCGGYLAFSKYLFVASKLLDKTGHKWSSFWYNKNGGGRAQKQKATGLVNRCPMIAPHSLGAPRIPLDFGEISTASNVVKSKDRALDSFHPLRGGAH